MSLADLHEPLLPIFTELVRWADWPPARRLLDAGCGTGLKTALLATAVGQQGEIIGVDYDATALHAARTAGNVTGVATQWIAGDITKLPLADATVDGVWCSAVIGLINEPAMAFAEFRRVLRPGGTALIATGAQCWAAVHQWPPNVSNALATAYEHALANGQLTPPLSELGDELTTQTHDAGFTTVTARAFLIEPTGPSPFVAELALTPWTTLRPLLAPLLDTAILASADTYAAAPEDAELISVLLAARATR